MKSYIYTVSLILILLISISESKSFSPKNKTFGFGIMLGEPTGLTAKLWVDKEQAIAFGLGNSYLGAFRLGADYLFHFDAFNSRIVNMYAGPGLAVGFGESGGWWYHNKNKYWYKENDEIGFGVRGVFGINIVPKRTPLEIFGEVGVLIGMVPATRADVEGSIGIRFYF